MLTVLSLVLSSVVPAAAAAPAPALIPAPEHLSAPARCSARRLDRPLRFAPGVDRAGFEIVRDRWTSLGIAAPVVAQRGPVDVVVEASGGPPGAYTLDTCGGGVAARGSDGDARFDALVTLAQLPVRDGAAWRLPAVAIADRPALRWRIVSDDVSRGPFPTMAYAKRRIRTLAALKINGWSPYMEHVVRDPRFPFIASPDGWTPEQLRDLTAYARRFHVTLIPEQQTFAHLHEVLKWESAAPLAELPHGYLVAESDPRTYAYLGPLLREVVAATAPAPFVHVGADEPLDLGRGRTPRSAAVVAEHIRRVAAFLDGRARPIVWDDAIQQDPAILGLIPKNTVVATFHYGVEPSYKKYVETVANAGFDQLISPSAANFTELYPDLATSYANTARFLADARGARGMLGMFFTVWHDDGETLFEATWPSIAYAAAAAWQTAPVDDATWHRTFARAFYGSDDPRYAADLDTLRSVRGLIATKPGDPPDYVFWHDPFDARLQARAALLDLAALRARAETVLAHLWTTRPPLNAGAASAMLLGALRYDILGRRLQIGKEAHGYYDDARTQATGPGIGGVYRSLNVAKYLCWELRDELASLQPRYEAAWRAESTGGGLPRILARFTTAETDAQRCADRLDAVAREDYLRANRVPPWDEVMAR